VGGWPLAQPRQKGQGYQPGRKIIETELGIPHGTWSDPAKGGLARIDVYNAQELDLDIPFGSELSANEFYHPGGITSGGIPEARLIKIPDTHFKGTEILLSNNGSSYRIIIQSNSRK